MYNFKIMSTKDSLEAKNEEEKCIELWHGQSVLFLSIYWDTFIDERKDVYDVKEIDKISGSLIEMLTKTLK